MGNAERLPGSGTDLVDKPVRPEAVDIAVPNLVVTSKEDVAKGLNFQSMPARQSHQP